MSKLSKILGIIQNINQVRIYRM
uniref:Uncharacterized protein n=1 Tax=Rhizophora mucronata TaxID=61149 RepID=A0A2P2Q8S6_RHIMU